MSEANKQLVRRHFEELFNSNNDAVADELVAQEYLEHAIAPFGQAEPGTVNGPAHLRQTAQWLLAQFPDLHMTIEAIIAEGDTVAVRVLSEGTNLGPLNGVLPPTGKRFAARQSHWFRGPAGDAASGRGATARAAAVLADPRPRQAGGAVGRARRQGVRPCPSNTIAAHHSDRPQWPRNANASQWVAGCAGCPARPPR